MSLNPSVHFPDIGSFITVDNSLSRDLIEFKQDVVDAVEILDSDYIRIQLLPSFISNMTSAVNNIEQGRINITNSFSLYHTQVLKDEISSSHTTASGVITDLFAAMNAYGPAQTFMEDGNFHSYYRDQFSRLDVPVAPSGSNTVDDSLAE